MDYEKKYNEALKWMRELYPGLQGATKEDAEHYFPELRESEDERIRKRIYGLIYHNDALLDKDKLLDWLEKQKEQKPIKWIDLTWKDIVELEGIINNVHYEFRNGIGQESFGKEVLEKFREYKGDEYLDEKEQKPAWSEEDKDYYDTIVRKLEVIGDDSGLSDNQIKFLREHCPLHKKH